MTDEEIEKNKAEMQRKLVLSDDMADDPSSHVKALYHNSPDVDSSDEKFSDVNIEGIKAFAATLEKNPFALSCNLI